MMFKKVPIPLPYAGLRPRHFKFPFEWPTAPGGGNCQAALMLDGIK